MGQQLDLVSGGLSPRLALRLDHRLIHHLMHALLRRTRRHRRQQGQISRGLMRARRRAAWLVVRGILWLWQLEIARGVPPQPPESGGPRVPALGSGASALALPLGVGGGGLVRARRGPLERGIRAGFVFDETLDGPPRSGARPPVGGGRHRRRVRLGRVAEAQRQRAEALAQGRGEALTRLDEEKLLPERRARAGQVGVVDDRGELVPDRVVPIRRGRATDGHLIVVAVEAQVGRTLVARVAASVVVVRVDAQVTERTHHRRGEELGEKHEAALRVGRRDDELRSRLGRTAQGHLQQKLGEAAVAVAQRVVDGVVAGRVALQDGAHGEGDLEFGAA
mmetsp:Transcript_18065/g.48772  ORF Transcript_18065/g.48772 Transcript_18065/m.48772 type:complete len:336 (-) Transcript_18065:2357-3364(-)